jgi:hypothetical protein
MRRPSLRPESSLSAGLIRREAIQLLVVAALAATPLLFASKPANVIAAVIALIALGLSAIAGLVAWRVGGRTPALGLYGLAAVVFALLAIANLQH